MILRRGYEPALAALVLAVLGGCVSPGEPGQASRSRAGRVNVAPAPHPVIGRIVAIDPELRLAFVEVAPETPAKAVERGATLTARTDALVETARLEATGHRRSRTLGTRIVSGQPKPGDEVVWGGSGNQAPTSPSAGPARPPTP